VINTLKSKRIDAAVAAIRRGEFSDYVKAAKEFRGTRLKLPHTALGDRGQNTRITSQFLNATIFTTISSIKSGSNRKV
jgi:hypothetical protein